MSRLETLMSLREGWDGPSSVAVTGLAHANYNEFIRALGIDIHPDVEPMATPSGGIRMEWERGDYTYIAEIQGDGGLYLCALGPTPTDDRDVELKTMDVRKLTRFFRDGTIGR